MSLGSMCVMMISPPGSDADGNVVSAPEIDTRGKSKASGSPSKRGKPPAKRRAGKQKSGSQAGSSTASSQVIYCQVFIQPAC